MPADLTVAVAIRRRVHDQMAISAHCAALQHTLRGQARDALTSIMSILDDAAHDVLMHDPDALVARLAHPDYHAALRRALDRLSDLPPEVVVPTFVALTRCASRHAAEGAAAPADALRAHGDVVLAVTDASRPNAHPAHAVAV